MVIVILDEILHDHTVITSDNIDREHDVHKLASRVTMVANCTP